VENAKKLGLITWIRGVHLALRGAQGLKADGAEEPGTGDKRDVRKAVEEHSQHLFTAKGAKTRNGAKHGALLHAGKAGEHNKQ